MERAANFIRSEIGRYFLAVALGLAVDLTVAYGLRKLLAIPLVVSATVGFCAGVIVNYVNFEKWVFGTGTLCWQGLIRVFMAAQGALIVRLACVWILSRAPLTPLIVLLLATAVSFLVNFVFSKIAIKRDA